MFLSRQVKQSVIISHKSAIYVLPHELPNELRLRILGNQEISQNCQNLCIGSLSNEVLVNTGRKQKLNFSCCALFHISYTMFHICYTILQYITKYLRLTLVFIYENKSQCQIFCELLQLHIIQALLRDSSVNVVSLFGFTITFCDHLNILLIISNFLKIGQVIVSNWYQNLDYKLIRECVQIVLLSLNSRLTISHILVGAKRLYFKKLIEAFKGKE